MEILGFFEDYFVWHYSRALKEIVGICKNFLWFIYNFFSIPVILKTFFSPWRRLKEEYHSGDGIEALFGSIVITFIMRIIGIGIRLVTLCLGLISLVLACLLFIAIFVLWLLIPLFVILLFYQGFHELFA